MPGESIARQAFGWKKVYRTCMTVSPQTESKCKAVIPALDDKHLKNGFMHVDHGWRNATSHR
jgi:hypothetical protein